MPVTTQQTLNKILFLFLISISFFVHAQQKYEEGKVYRHKLDNGLIILTMEQHLSPFIFHQLTYKVGARNEHLGITGLSHIVEHMMFKGTPKYGKGETSRIISQNSGVFNAFTANDMTSYYEYLPVNKIELAFDIESDRMMNSIFDPDEFESEREVILQERRMRSESKPSGIMQEMMNNIAFQNHPNRDPIIGWPVDISNVSRDKAVEYYRTYYTPNNAILVLVGNFNTDDILKMADKYYGKIPKGPEVPEKIILPQEQIVKKSFTLKHNDINTPYFRMAFHVPNYLNEDFPAIRLAGMMLSERSRDARLHKRLVLKEKIASRASGGVGITKDPTLFNITVEMTPDSSIERAVELVWEEIKLMQNEIVSDHELQKVKNRYRFNQVTGSIKNSDIASRISRYETYAGWESRHDFDQRIMMVSKEDIQRVMQTYFDEDKVTIGYGLPKSDSKIGKRISTEEAEENDTEDYNNHSDEFNKFYFLNPLQLPEETISDPGEFDDIIRPNPIAPLIKSDVLSNGIKVYFIENHLVPALFIGGIIETGLIPEEHETNQPGISAVLSDVMNRGSQNTTYEELAERMAFVPYQFSVKGGLRGFSFQGYALLENVDEMLQTGFDIITKPALRDDDITYIKSRHSIAAKNRLKKTSVKAFYYMYNKIFENHLFTQTTSTEESIKSISKEDLEKIHQKYFTPELTTIVMVGDYTPQEMKNLAEKYFGGLRSSGSDIIPIELTPVTDLNEKIIKIFPEKDYTECTINIGFKPFDNISKEDEEAVKILNYILASSALTSRIGVELRDKQGLIYGIKSELWSTRENVGYWKFNTKTGPENVEKVITGIFSEIKKLFAEGVTDEEIVTAKKRLLGLLPLFIETPDDIASRVFELLRDKESFEYFDKRADRILSVTKEDVMRIADKYLTLDNFIIVVDGPLQENSMDGLINKL